MIQKDCFFIYKGEVKRELGKIHNRLVGVQSYLKYIIKEVYYMKYIILALITILIIMWSISTFILSQNKKEIYSKIERSNTE